MVARLTLKEKIAALDTTSTPLASLGLNAYNWWSEATHGISHVRNDERTPFESNFAFPITTAMAFNRSLWRVTGEQIGREARAFMNVGNAWSTYWAPVVNLAREPRWGRNIETPGEDPYLSGEYATAFVSGFQQAPEAPDHLMASACCKHYVASASPAVEIGRPLSPILPTLSPALPARATACAACLTPALSALICSAADEMEHSTVANETWTRHNFDATISARDLVDSYMLPFQVTTLTSYLLPRRLLHAPLPADAHAPVHTHACGHGIWPSPPARTHAWSTAARTDHSRVHGPRL